MTTAILERPYMDMVNCESDSCACGRVFGEHKWESIRVPGYLCEVCWEKEEKEEYNIGETPEGTRCTGCGCDPGGEDCYSPDEGIILCWDCWKDYEYEYIRK